MDKIVALLDPKDVVKLIVLTFVAAGLWFGMKHEFELIHRDLETLKSEAALSEQDVDNLKICCAANRIEIRTMAK